MAGVRIPRSWIGTVTPLAGSGPGGYVGVRRIPVTDVALYTVPVTVDLGNDGMAPFATFGGFPGGSGSVGSPGAFAAIVQFTVAAGTYTIVWTVGLSGTLAAGDANNFGLYVDGVQIATSVNPAAAGTYPQTAVTAPITAAANNLKILALAAGTAGSVYSATMAPVGQGAQAQIGPTGLGASWSLDQCFLSTSVGQLDTAQCVVYVGPNGSAGVPQYAVTGSLAGGGSQFGLGGVAVPDGWVVTAVWTGGTFGAQAYLRVTGLKTVLSA